MATAGEGGGPEPPWANPSGAPEAGGATSRGSSFGGQSLEAQLLRMVARWSRAVEGWAYRRLRELDKNAPEPRGWRGRPHRAREAATPEATRPTPS